MTYRYGNEAASCNAIIATALVSVDLSGLTTPHTASVVHKAKNTMPEPNAVSPYTNVAARLRHGGTNHGKPMGDDIDPDTMVRGTYGTLRITCEMAVAARNKLNNNTTRRFRSVL